jgi:hypothetical protein
MVLRMGALLRVPGVTSDAAVVGALHLARDVGLDGAGIAASAKTGSCGALNL